MSSNSNLPPKVECPRTHLENLVSPSLNQNTSSEVLRTNPLVEPCVLGRQHNPISKSYQWFFFETISCVWRNRKNETRCFTMLCCFLSRAIWKHKWEECVRKRVEFSLFMFLLLNKAAFEVFRWWIKEGRYTPL